jgi:hypothetical protein
MNLKKLKEKNLKIILIYLKVRRTLKKHFVSQSQTFYCVDIMIFFFLRFKYIICKNLIFFYIFKSF